MVAVEPISMAVVTECACRYKSGEQVCEAQGRNAHDDENDRDRPDDQERDADQVKWRMGCAHLVTSILRASERLMDHRLTAFVVPARPAAVDDKESFEQDEVDQRFAAGVEDNAARPSTIGELIRIIARRQRGRTRFTTAKSTRRTSWRRETAPSRLR